MKTEPINYKYQSELVHSLYQITKEDKMRDFLDVLLTPAELDDLAKRLQIFKRLLKGEAQQKIAKHLKVGVATVVRGAAELRAKRDKVEKMIKQ